ncbi:MAG: hypothetical protein KDA20_07895 [Phycisphaerales bacterium]|nr:hypothetical protein [Phycisphaerales bacterium]
MTLTSRILACLGGSAITAAAAMAQVQPATTILDDAPIVKPKREAPLTPRVGTPSAGEACLDATPITCNASFSYDNALTTGGWDEIDLNDPNQNFCIGNTNEPERNTYWFSFIASDTTAQVHTCDSLATDSSMQVYSGACGSLVEVGCAEDNCGTTTWNGYIYLEGLTIGATYYIQVGSWEAAVAGEYTLNIVCPAEDCVTLGSAQRNQPPIFLDNDGPAADIDFVQNGNAADTPSVIAGNNNNYGCIWPDTGVGPGGTENDPDSIQHIGPISEATIYGTTFMSQRSDAPATTYFRDYDWYGFYAPIDPNDGPNTTLQYEFRANTQKGFFIFQKQECQSDPFLCVQLPPAVCDDVYYAAFNYYPHRAANGGVGDCNVHYFNNSAILADGEGYNLIIRTTRDFDGAMLPSQNSIAHEYVVHLSFQCNGCPDVDHSGTVDLADLNLVLFAFGNSVSPGLDGDADCDGDVDLADLNAVLFAFGTSPGC